jgi:hypothetical protein
VVADPAGIGSLLSHFSFLISHFLQC